MIFLKLFSCIAFLIPFVNSSILKDNISGDLSDNPTFGEVFSHLAELLSYRDVWQLWECPYSTSKIISTLHKYAKCGYQCSISVAFYRYFTDNESYKYQPIVLEMEKAFYSMNTDARWEHISSWKLSST